MFLAVKKETSAGGDGAGEMGKIFGKYGAELVREEVLQTFLPLFAFAEEDMDVWKAFMEGQMESVMPLYHFRGSDLEGDRPLSGSNGEREELTLEDILKEEGKEAQIEEESQEGEEDLMALFLAENQAAGDAGMRSQAGGADAGDQSPTGERNAEGSSETEGDPAGEAEGNLAGDGEGSGTDAEGRNQNDAGNRDNAGNQNGAGGQDQDSGGQGEGSLPEAGDWNFTPRTEKQAVVNLDGLRDYETLVQTFYTIDSSTMIGSDQLDVDVLSSKDMSISKDTEGPQILIYHTHSQEAFADSLPGDRATSIVGVGDYLTRILSEEYGYKVLHHDGTYDVPSRDDAYSAALPAIEQVLEENPGIQVVIDLHRDAMDEKTRLVTEIDGRPTARFMFFNGLSRTRRTGNISYLYNENLDDNLAFSFQLEKVAQEYYPGLTRKIYLKAYRYNMHLRPRNLLIELGAQNNTVEEAMNACGPIAHILDLVLSGKE